MKYQEITGDLIQLTLAGRFDVIAHGCNCFCRQKSGLAPQMVKAFGTDRFPLEDKFYEGDITKLGDIDSIEGVLLPGGKFYSSAHDIEDWKNNLINARVLYVVNAYTQYKIKKFNQYDYPYTTSDNPLDYEALTLCMRKMNQIFKGKHIGLPQIGAGKAKGDWDRIKPIIQKELKDCDVTVVIYNS